MTKLFHLTGLLVGAIFSAAGFQAVADESIVDGVGVVLESVRGNPKPIFVFDEYHNSAKVQIEQAIMMNRLYNKRGMRDIALEAYLFSDPAIDANWYKRAAGNSDASRARVATRLLGEGEISAAEFMALVYDDITVHPTEVAAEYHVSAPQQSSATIEYFLFLIAQQKGARLLQSDAQPLKDAAEKYRILKDGGASTGVLRKAEDVVVNERSMMLRNLFSVDPWLVEQHEYFKEPLSSLDEWKDRAQSIKARATADSINVEKKLLDKMDTIIKFYGGRAKASYTMANAALDLARTVSGESVSLVIGAGHTADVSNVLRKQKHQFVTIRPVTTSNANTYVADIKFDLWKRRADGHSLYSTGLMGVINELVDEKKNPPTITEPWLQMKAELYLIVDRLTHAVLSEVDDNAAGLIFDQDGGSELPPADIDRNWVSFDPSKLEIVSDDSVADEEYFYLSDEALERLKTRNLATEILRVLTDQRGVMTTIEKNAQNWGGENVDTTIKTAIADETRVIGVPTVFFPVVLNFRNPGNQRVLWVKAARTRTRVLKQERENVEAFLLQELEQARQSNGIKESKLEDKQGRVQVSTKAIMAIGSDVIEVRNRSVTSI